MLHSGVQVSLEAVAGCGSHENLAITQLALPLTYQVIHSRPPDSDSDNSVLQAGFIFFWLQDVEFDFTNIGTVLGAVVGTVGGLAISLAQGMAVDLAK